jgi:tripartite-type tricarboxylate transporter receptor subunit TctC
LIYRKRGGVFAIEGVPAIGARTPPQYTQIVIFHNNQSLLGGGMQRNVLGSSRGLSLSSSRSSSRTSSRSSAPRAAFVAVSASLAFTALAAPMLAQAQAWPDKPVKIIIPFPPGGTLDKVGRMLAEDLGKQFGHNFIVDNRPGGNGIIGADAVAKSAADGYTLLFNASTFVTAAMTMKSVPYKVQSDFEPIGLVAQAPLAVSLANKLNVTDIKGLVAAAKAKPATLNFAVGSIGSAGHLCTVKLEQAAGISVNIVPYRGTTPAMQDLAGGQIDGFIDPVLGSVQQHKGGLVRMAAVTSAKRLPNVPDVPTVAETLPRFECASWYGLWAPTKTPADVVGKLNAAINKALAGPVRDRLLADGIVPGGGTQAEFAKFQADDIAASGKIITEKKIAVEQ